MKRIATTLALVCLMAGLTEAQPVRNGIDVVWARDVQGAEMVLDGTLDEAAWASAETIELTWEGAVDNNAFGRRIEGNPALVDPIDPNDGTLYILRDGNNLWLGLDVRDASIGGTRSLWTFDGFIMAMIDRTRRDLVNYENANSFDLRPVENIYGWFHPSDTLAGGLPVPGIAPRYFGDYGLGFGDSLNTERTPEEIEILDWAYSIEGFANDDSETDVGYTFEVRYDLEALGYDFTQEDGDMLPFSFALQDADYNWPFEENMYMLSRVWFQGQWANNFNDGAGYIRGAPGVTIDSGDAPEVTEHEFEVHSVGDLGAVTVDGSLDEAAWGMADTLFTIQYQPQPDVLDMNVGTIAPYFVRWFRPDLNSDGNAALVVDPSTARVQMLVDGQTLYVGVDVDDQAVSGVAGESGRDGLRIFFTRADSLNNNFQRRVARFDTYVDSTGSLVVETTGTVPGSDDGVSGAVSLKGASTAADPNDVDEGYQIELAIDLVDVLGFPEDLGNGRIGTALNFFDGDFLQNPVDSYVTRTWIVNERAPEGASIVGFLNAGTGVPIEPDRALPHSIRLMGNYPNPFNPATSVRYALGTAGEVSVQVFDVLGRQVAALAPGVQTAGTHELTFDAAGLASGVYLYRVVVTDQASGQVRSSATGRMVLHK